MFESGCNTADGLPRGRGQTIMVVDDEPSLVALAEETLTGLNYEAVGFGSSTAALEAFRAAPHWFDAVPADAETLERAFNPSNRPACVSSQAAGATTRAGCRAKAVLAIASSVLTASTS